MKLKSVEFARQMQQQEDESVRKGQLSPVASCMTGLLASFGWDFKVLLVYNMYEVVDYFDKQGD